ncbi:MAG: Swt1 family HEPN domain-containing protein [Actinomycetota bacterium]
MAKTNYQRVGDALEALSRGLAPFVDRECAVLGGPDWADKYAAESAAQDKQRGLAPRKFSPNDISFLLKVMWDLWHSTFGKILGQAERSLVSELRTARNAWAHQENFTSDDTYRALDSVHRLLLAVSAGDQAAEVERAKNELLRVRFDEQARSQKKKAPTAGPEGQIVAGLKPWREVITPHEDVCSGRYSQAEFAADLAQVLRGEGSDEYRDPAEFFRRTFLTDGLKQLLVEAVRRVSKQVAAPVVQLQTNFGGGKTHALLGLYHLFSGAKASELPGIDSVLAEAKVSEIPKTNRAVLVGTNLSPGQAHVKPDGTEIRTLWGELAWQLGGAEGFALVAQADATTTNPGGALTELFRRYGPCLVLIDEWVAYARQLYGKDQLVGGSFDAHFTFAQALTEAARATEGVLVVVSIPASDRDGSGASPRASDIEVGGEGGRAALERLRNVIGRMESPWRPATTEESFEIVRRRLFEDMTGPNFALRDAVAKSFGDFYRSQSQDFPAECKEAAYERRMKSAYPIHPELFDRLYEDWSSLERFQRTRGVLRLMAAVIHALWESNDMSPLILPGSIPIDDAGVFPELTRYLEDNWKPVIESDVDGPNSLPLQLDRANPNLGRYSACRRVARTIYMGSAPKSRGGQRGIEDRRIRLGCALPGESTVTFGDALRRLNDRATYLYEDGLRYWYSVNPSMTSIAKDRADQRSPEEVAEEINVRLLRDSRTKGDFAGVHATPATPSDVPDAAEARLVILSPEHTHSTKTADSPALGLAAEFLSQRGAWPRRYRNMLVFLAADADKLADLDQAVRQYLAWASIEEDAGLNLDDHSRKQAVDRRKDSSGVVDQRILETYQWLLCPTMPDPDSDLVWETMRLQGPDPLAVRAANKLKSQDGLITRFGGVPLRLQLDRVPGLWRGDHVGLAQLWEDFAQYPYLPRLRDSSVLANAVSDGIGLLTWQKDTFAYAQAFDEASGRFAGLKVGEQSSVAIDSQSVLVKAEVAAAQIETEKPAPPADGPGGDGGVFGSAGGTGVVARQAGDSVLGTETDGKPADNRPRRFHGSVKLDPVRIGRDAGEIAESIVQHLVGQGHDVEITLEIQAEIPEGASDETVRTVTENAQTLKFKTHGFERA